MHIIGGIYNARYNIYTDGMVSTVQCIPTFKDGTVQYNRQRWNGRHSAHPDMCPMLTIIWGTYDQWHHRVVEPSLEI